jgi:hypothetical protein
MIFYVQDFVQKKKDYLFSQVGNPEGPDKPNKKVRCHLPFGHSATPTCFLNFVPPAASLIAPSNADLVDISTTIPAFGYVKVRKRL